MAKLVFSKGLLIEQDPTGFCISHDDDIIIEANIQLPLRMLKSKKSIYVYQSIDATEILAKQDLHIQAPIQPHKLQARKIFFNNLPQKAFVGEDVLIQGVPEAENITIDGNMFLQTVHCNTNLHCKGDLESDICFVEGDIKIEGSCISQTVIAYGDIHIHSECEVDMLISIHGNIVIDGPTKGELYRGQEIMLQGKSNYVRALQSYKSIQVGDGIIEADIMIAPKVNLHPQLQGRIMVVDSQESLGPHLIKGCLGMDFLDSFIGDSQSFLKQRNVHSSFVIPTFEELTGRTSSLQDVDVLEEIEKEMESIEEPIEESKISNDIEISITKESDLKEEDIEKKLHTNGKDYTKINSVIHMDPIIEIDDFSNENFEEGILHDDETTLQTGVKNSKEDTIREDILTLTFSKEESEEPPLQIQAGVLSTANEQIQISPNEIPEQDVDFEDDSSEEISLYPSAVAVYESEEPASDGKAHAHLLDLQTIDPSDHFFPYIKEDVQRILDSYQSRPHLPPPIVELLQFIHDQKYESLLENMFVLWRNISKYHNETQSKSPPIVMPTFNKIHAKLRSHFSNSKE